MLRRSILAVVGLGALALGAVYFANGRTAAAAPAAPAEATAPVAADSVSAPAAADPAPGGARGKAAELKGNLKQRARQHVGAIEAVGDRLFEDVPNLLAGIFILLFFWYLSGLSVRVLRRVFERAQTDPSLAALVLPLCRLSILVIGALAAVEQMGFDVSSLLAGVGIVGLAIGLAAQETLSNLLAGIALLWDRPFRLGDSVTIGNQFGTVTQIGLRSTRLRTLEQLEVIIPNKEVAQQKVVNHSYYSEIRLNVPFAIGYGEDVPRVRELVLGAIAGRDDLLREPAPQLVVTALGESGVQVELRVWLKTPAPATATPFSFLEQIKAVLDQAEVEIPFLHRRLVPGAAPAGAPTGGRREPG